MRDSLDIWIKKNHLQIKNFEETTNTLEMDDVGCFLVLSDKECVFDKEMNLILENLPQN